MTKIPTHPPAIMSNLRYFCPLLSNSFFRPLDLMTIDYESVFNCELFYIASLIFKSRSAMELMF